MSSNSSPAAGVWRTQAAQWDRIGPPLRPSPADLAHHEEVILRVSRECSARGASLCALALGVTPEHAFMRWPPGSTLLALDKSAEMIERVWPGHPRPGEGALLADWLSPPADLGPYDIVVSDGPFGVLRHPDEHTTLLSRIRGWLSPHGRFTFRVFVRPDTNETSKDVFDAALDGSAGLESFHAFKLRLLMAVQTNVRDGVRIGRVWDVWHEHGPGAVALGRARGWPLEQISTIDAYRGSDSIYCFPTLSELRESISAARLVEESCSVADYPLGDRCPRFVLERPLD